jgi:uncharacterized protein
MNEKQKVCILSIDGGGIRGIIPAVILKSIQEKIGLKGGQHNDHIINYFDLVAGTSTGGILACGLLAPAGKMPKFTIDNLLDLYVDKGQDIFQRRYWTGIGPIFGHRYKCSNLEEILSKYFGDIKLSELIKPCIISSYDIVKRKTHFFTSFNASVSSRDFKVRDVLKATSAAPTYFEPARIRSLNDAEYALIDGGVFVNNPSLCAYAEARRMMFREKDVAKPSARDMIIVSIGTGKAEKSYLYRKAKKWGAAGWISPLINIMMSANSETVDYQLRAIYDTLPATEKSCYLRLQMDLPVNRVSSDMDDASEKNINALKDIANHFVTENDDVLGKLADLLLKNNVKRTRTAEPEPAEPA